MYYVYVSIHTSLSLSLSALRPGRQDARSPSQASHHAQTQGAHGRQRQREEDEGPDAPALCGTERGEGCFVHAGGTGPRIASAAFDRKASELWVNPRDTPLPFSPRGRTGRRCPR